MDSWKRSLIRPMLMTKLSDLHGEAFERFFHELMQRSDPGFFPIRAQGSIGDLGADGLVVNDGKLYACYGPQVFDTSEVKNKFKNDLAKARARRADEFGTFVFVHNDLRGVGPEVSREISTAKHRHPELDFEQLGPSRMCRILRGLPEHDVEDLIGYFPVQEVVTGSGMEDLAPLLEHLGGSRKRGPAPDRVVIPPQRKLDYNRFSPDSRDQLVRAMRYVHLASCTTPGAITR